MNRFLVFQLYGPLAAFGDAAVGQDRHVFAYPTKSAVVGLLAASLGIRRGEDAALLNLSNSFSMNLLVLSGGRPLMDFHIAQLPKIPKGAMAETRRDEAYYFDPKNTSLSSRDYRVDSYSVAALELSENGAHSPEALKEAMEYPVFQQYLGRKSCALGLPMKPALMEGETPREVLCEYFRESVVGDGRPAKDHRAFLWDIDARAKTGGRQNPSRSAEGNYPALLVLENEPKTGEYAEIQRSGRLLSSLRRQFAEAREFTLFTEVECISPE